MNEDEKYMARCLQLAKLGAGQVAPNPMVGAVLVYNGRIIGEGYHKKYGEAHAEVNCINAVSETEIALIEKSTIYVSLEPCAHHGKTPPCADLIIRKKIKKVVIGCQDVYKEVAGKGIEKLQQAGVEVAMKILEHECLELNKRFFTFHQKLRPYVILKWAQSANGKIGAAGKRLHITNEFTNRLVHSWRAQEAAILVGAATAANDDPLLTTRLWKGKDPVRIVIDKNLTLSFPLKIFNNSSTVFVFNYSKNAIEKNIHYVKLPQENTVACMMQSLYENNIQSVLIEGGAKTLQAFIDTGCWDEARVITNENFIIENGIAAPDIKNFHFTHSERIFADTISYFTNSSSR